MKIVKILSLSVIVFIASIGVAVACTPREKSINETVNNTPSIEPSVNPCISITTEDQEVETCPTPTLQVSEIPATPTATPAATGGGQGDGLSDGRSDGLSSCPECTKAPVPNAPPATGRGDNW